MNRFHLPSLLSVLVFAPCTSVADAKEAAGSRPNIVFMLADDMGWAQPGFNGGSKELTPNIDKLAAGGLKLTQFYTHSVCAPTRGAFLTGRYAFRNWMDWRSEDFGKPSYLKKLGLTLARNEKGEPTRRIHALDTNERTIAEALKEAGYFTALIGKWHCGEWLKEHLPMQQGFMHQYGHYAWGIDYYTKTIVHNAPARFAVYDWHRNQQPLNEEGYTTDLFAAEAERVVARQTVDRPFFLYVPFNAVHGPLNEPPRYHDKHDVRSAMLKCLDDAVGRIVAAIDKHGFKDNTLVIFTNDNGPVLEEMSKPYRGTKNTTFEGGVRVPCLVRWPGHTDPGSSNDGMMFIADWFSTFITLAGGKHEQELPVDAIDMAKMLFDGRPSPRDEIIFEVTGSVRLPTIRSGDYKLMGDMLLNIKEDPSETTDIADRYPEIVKKLAARLDEVGKGRPPLGNKPLLMDPPLPYVYGLEENKNPPQWLKEAVDKVRATQPKSWAPGETPWPQAPKGANVALSVAVPRPAGAQDPKPDANLLPNPSFEENQADSVRGWTSRAWQGKENGRWTVVSPGRTGKQCLSIHSERGTDAAWSTTLTVKPNSFYRLSGWIKTEDVQGAAGALLNIQNMQHVRIQNMQHVRTTGVKGTADWTRVSTVFRTAEAAELEINCLFGGWGESTGRAWYDDVSLEPIADLSEEADAIVTIDTDAPSVAYSPLLFGGFIEHFHRQIYGGLFEPGSPLSDENGFRKDVIEAMRELKLSIVRWPGGCFASGYHWKDGVGRKRQPTFDVVWGAEDPNTFGTDEFVAWCRLVGCEPYICTNAGNGTPEEMKDWVEYCNGTKGRYAQMRIKNGYTEPLGVRYWSIGNENWGGHEIGRKTPKQWGPLVLKSAELMLAADPELTLLAAATPNRDWTLPLLATAGKHLDYVAIHRYWLPCWGRNLTPDYVSCIMLSEGPEEMITRAIDVIEEAGYRGRIKIALDEWNLRGWHHPGFPRKQAGDAADPAVRELIEKRDINADASQYSMADALFSASLLNACLRHAEDVGMANIAPVVNTRGPLYVHRNGIVRRTTFHTLAMYANELEARVGRLDLEAGMLVQGKRFLPVLDAVATVDESGKTWSIALVNRHPSRHVACTVRMKDTLLRGRYNATILAGDSPAAFNDIKRPNRVVPEKTQLTFNKGVVKLAPHSLTIVRIRWK